uniref:Uncharacterized protein n=1 Tax=Solanum lycopersicum TaxID=4081 RepID=A0A3Q7EW14_SOLLC
MIILAIIIFHTVKMQDLDDKCSLRLSTRGEVNAASSLAPKSVKALQGNLQRT